MIQMNDCHGKKLKPFEVPLEMIPYVDYPELQIDEHESTEMPFRYVIDTNKSPIMPEVSHRLIWL